MKLTAAGLQKLKDEIKKTEKELKETLAAKGEAAETGGNVWHDNFAFEQLVQQETGLVHKLKELKDRLNEVKVVGDRNNPKRDGVGAVGVGSKVTLKLENGAEKTFIIGDPETADPPKGIISYASPLGKALTKSRIGEEKEYLVDGRIYRVKILKIF